MAYDKVIDSSVLEANLKSVANAIRTKGGTSANLAFPTGFVNAISAIEAGGGNMEKREITIASDNVSTSARELTLLTNNAFVKEHYAKDGFYVVLRPKSSITNKVGYGALLIYHGNRQLASGVSATHGVNLIFNSAASGVNVAGVTAPINGTTWNFGFRVTSAGNLVMYLPANRNVAAGTYELFLVCEE